jgi:hypothetical protein
MLTAGQVVDGTVVARRRSWFGRERYLIEFGVDDVSEKYTYTAAAWRSIGRKLWPVSSSLGVSS